MLDSFILFVIYNLIYEKLILEFTGIKVIYQARILTASKFVPILSKMSLRRKKKKTFSEYFNKNQLIYNFKTKIVEQKKIVAKM